jgi:hypothetical protein
MTVATTATDWRETLSARKNERIPNRLRPTEKGALLDAVAVQTPALDVSERSAKFIISTPTPDRSDDVVDPLGVMLDNYRKNPVCFYDHGFSGITQPIGKCEDADGNLAMVVTKEGIEATCYFADSYEANQIYELVKGGFLRSASINMTPLDAEVRSDGGAGRSRPGLLIKEWELLEFSVVAIPDNPEAVRKAIAGGEITSPSLIKSLSKGFSMTKSITKSDKPADDKKPDDEAAGSSKPDKEGDEEDEGEPESRPGSKALHKCYGRMQKAYKAASKEAGVQENDKVKGLMQSHAEVCKDEMDSIAACHKSEYDSEIKDDEDGDADGDEMKSLAANARTPRQMRGLLATVKEIARAKNLTPAQRQSIFAIANRCDALVAEAVTKAAESQEVDEFETLKKEAAGLIQTAKRLAPANA